MLRARVLVGLLCGLVALPPVTAEAARKSYVTGEPVAIPTRADCAPMPLPTGGKLPWEPGEKLSYDIDVLGANAGKLALVALPPVGKGSSQELPFRALAASNSFFSKLRKVRGKSTSYVRARDMHPRRYEEMSTEGDLKKSAEVVFQKPDQGAGIVVDWKRNQTKGKRKLQYLNEGFDPLSVIYYFRTVDLKQGQKLCFDSYGIRKLWRVSGEVKGLETVKVPAGTFQAWHIEGRAVRTDEPRSHREVHIWISNDERRLPLAALGVIDLGPVRAQLTHVGTGGAQDSEEQLAGPTVAEASEPGAGPEQPAPSEAKATTIPAAPTLPTQEAPKRRMIPAPRPVPPKQ